jgi:hypothetical protein
MRQKCLWCGILVFFLSVGLAPPARAVNPDKVVIAIGATAAAAAIVLFVTISSLHHRRKSIVITGCVVSAESGMAINADDDKKLYSLSGDTTGVKPGDRMSLLGKETKSNRHDQARGWEITKVVKDFGACQP